MIKFKLNGKPLAIPSSWEEVTYSQYLKMIEVKSDVEMISTFTGIDEETLRKATITGLDTLIAALGALGVFSKPAAFKTPDKIMGVPVPKNIKFESLGQFEDMRKLIMSGDMALDLKIESPVNPRLYVEGLRKICAIYIQKEMDGEYSYTKAMEMDFNNAPAHEVIGAGTFFFARVLNLLTGTQASSPQPSKTRTKKKQVGRSSAKSSRRTR